MMAVGCRLVLPSAHDAWYGVPSHPSFWPLQPAIWTEGGGGGLKQALSSASAGSRSLKVLELALALPSWPTHVPFAATLVQRSKWPSSSDIAMFCEWAAQG